MADNITLNRIIANWICSTIRLKSTICTPGETFIARVLNNLMQLLAVEQLLESVFCLLLVWEAFFLHEIVKMLEEVVVGWQEAW